MYGQKVNRPSFFILYIDNSTRAPKISRAGCAAGGAETAGRKTCRRRRREGWKENDVVFVTFTRSSKGEGW